MLYLDWARDARPAELSIEIVERGIVLFKKRLEDLRQLDPAEVKKQDCVPQFEKVAAGIADAVIRTFGNNTVEYNRYKAAAHFDTGPSSSFKTTPISEVHAALAKSLATSIALVEQAIESLEERRRDFDKPRPQMPRKPILDSKKVFIVHGRDDAPRESLARFLEKLGLEVIILHEQPNKGRTVIEKIGAHSEVGFAVILLTPDDHGALVGEELSSRARQNVLPELGYFVGKLGRERVCTISVGDVEVPSDWRGVINAAFDTQGAWKNALVKELQAAGYEIDWNKVMG